jgi:hypothetical protein
VNHLRASGRQDASNDSQTRIELPLIGTGEERLRALFDGLAVGGTVGAQLERQFRVTSSAPFPASTALAGRSTSAPPAPDTPSHGFPRTWDLQAQ